MADASQKTSPKATLSRVDKPDEKVVFEIPPQKVNRSFQSEYTKLAVLATPQPLLSYQHSESSITLPNLLVYGSQTGAIIKLLESWTKPMDGTLEPPTLKFDFIHLNIARCKLEKAEVTEDMWVGGAQPTRAEATITLAIYPEPPAVKTATIKKDTGTNVTLSPDELAKYLDQIEAKVKADPKYQYKKGDKIELKDESIVLLRGKEIGKLTDFVTLEKKHQEPKGKDAPQLPKSESSSPKTSASK